MAASRLACLLNFGCSDHAERPGCRAECGIMSRRLVQEMTHAGEDHGEAEAIGGGYDIVVADGAAGLNERGGAGLGGFFYAIGEREESVGGHDAALQGRLRFRYREFDGVDATHLAGTYAEGGAVACEDDRFGFWGFETFQV